MAHAYVTEEIVATAPTRVGLLADVSAALAEREVGIAAIGAYDKAGRGEFMMITTDNDTAVGVLEAMGMTVHRNDVTVLDAEDSPGSLSTAARMLAAAGMNVDWVYATTCGGTHASVVFKAVDPRRTAEILSG